MNWTVIQEDIGLGRSTFHVEPADDPTQSICTISTCNDEDPEKLAHLIAAAPDLLRELRHSRQGLSNLVEFGVLPDGYRDDARKFIDQYDAAIAKAEGRK